MSSSNVAIVPEYLDTGGGGISNITITGINGIIVTEPTPGNYEISMTPLTVVGGTGITVTEPTPNNYSIASTITVTAGAGMTVSQPTPENFQVTANIGITDGVGILVTEPTPSNFIIATDPSINIWVSAVTTETAPYINVAGGTGVVTLAPLNLAGLPYIQPNTNIKVRAILSGATQGFLNNTTNQFSIGLFSAGSFITGFSTPLQVLPDFNWGAAIPDPLNAVGTFATMPYSSLSTSILAAQILNSGSAASIDNVTMILVIQYTN
jgi:hypothetical protein